MIYPLGFVSWWQLLVLSLRLLTQVSNNGAPPWNQGPITEQSQEGSKGSLKMSIFHDYYTLQSEQ